MEVVEGAADFLPSTQQLAGLGHLHAHAVQLRLEERVLQGVKVEKAGLVEVPFAWPLLQGIGDLFPDLLVLLNHVIHVNVLYLGLADLRNGQTLPVDEQVGEVGAEILAGLRGQVLLQGLDEVDLLGFLVFGLVFVLEGDVGFGVGEVFLLCELQESADLFEVEAWRDQRGAHPVTDLEVVELDQL